MFSGLLDKKTITKNQ